MLEQPLDFTGCSSIQFFGSLPSLICHPFPKTVSHAAQGYLPLTVQHLCDLQDAMQCYWSPSPSHPILSREAEDFLSGGKYPKDVPLPTFLTDRQSV